MRYLHLIAAFAGEAWAMQPEKLAAIAEFLAFKAAGGQLSEAEIAARIDGRRTAAVARREGAVAVMPLVGVISQRAAMVEDVSTGGGVSADDFGARFDAFVGDDQVKAVVMDIDSVGGTVAGVEALAAKIRAARGAKPILAQVNSKAASAAYWLAAQADEIVVTPGGEAGSVGVYTVHEDISAKLAAEGVKATLIQAGAHKTELANLHPLSDEARTAVQARVDANYRAFVRDVAAGRGLTAGQVEDRFGQGRMFGEAELVKRGMADSVATLEQTLQRLGAAPQPRAQQRSREAFAAGLNPPLSVLEDVLRDAGFPKSLAVDFVSHGKAALRRGEPEPEATIPAEGLTALRTALAGFRLK